MDLGKRNWWNLHGFYQKVKSKLLGSKIMYEKNPGGKEVPEIITEIVKRNGFDYAKYLGVFKGYQIYQPCFREPAIFGRPRFIHVKGKKMRWSKSHSEASKVLNFFFDD